ncbi:NAD-dependent deacylase [Bacteroidales bacterium]
MKKRVVVLSGAGISAESGLDTFRGSDGLWANYKIEDVCTPDALRKNPEVVLNFYNMRREQLLKVEPNAAHYALAELEKHFIVNIVTQNVDNLHERAGSTNVLHLHGELLKSRSIKNPSLIIDTAGDVHVGDLAPDGSQLRPHIVFFGEEVPELERGAQLVSLADIFIVAGTSLAVYPAAGLVDYVSHEVPCFLVDPADVRPSYRKFNHIRKRACEGVPELCSLLISNF